MSFYVLINANGIKICESKKNLTTKEMQSLVGIEGEEASIQVASYSSFSDRSIKILCDDEFLIKGLKPVLVTKEGFKIGGQCLILGSNPQAETDKLLNQRQVDIVKKEACLMVSKP